MRELKPGTLKYTLHTTTRPIHGGGGQSSQASDSGPQGTVSGPACQPSSTTLIASCPSSNGQTLLALQVAAAAGSLQCPLTCMVSLLVLSWLSWFHHRSAGWQEAAPHSRSPVLIYVSHRGAEARGANTMLPLSLSVSFAAPTRVLEPEPAWAHRHWSQALGKQ